MLKKSVLTYLSAALIFLFTVPVTAQISQSGTLDGTVFNEEGNQVPGVLVTISSPALILPTMTTLSNQNGFFRFPALPPGKYKVTFASEAFKTLVQNGIVLNVSKTTSLNIALELSRIRETITVTGKTPTVDKARTTLVSSLSDEFLKNIPATRDVNTIFNMVPGVTGDTTHGSGARDNTYNVDGVNITDPVTGTRAGNFSMDIVEELSIQTGAHTAEHGGVRGAVINVVTKSGGNTFSGMVSAYFRNDKMQSDNTAGTIFEGQQTGFDYEVEPGVILGGPIVKDKLWFFSNFTMRKSEQFLAGYPWDSMGENTPLDYSRVMAYGKFTIQAGKSDRFTISYNFSDYKRNHRGAATNRTVDSSWIQETPVHVINTHWTHYKGNNFLLNVKAAYMDYHLNLTAKNDLPRIYDTRTRQYSQSYGYDDLYTRRRFQLMSDATLFVDNFMGRHELKAGFEMELSKDLRDRSHNHDSVNGLGPYVYVRNGAPYYIRHYQDFQRKDNKFVLGGFLQDSWTISDRLSVNLGVRIDHQEGIIPKQGNDREVLVYNGVTFDPRVPEKFKPLVWTTLAPRAGLIYDITGDGKTAFKMSFGRYYAANIMQFFITVNPNAFLYYRYRLDENWNIYGNMYSVGGQSAKTMDPDTKAPYIDELSIGIEREIIKDVRFGVRYLRKWDRNLLEDVKVSHMDYDAFKQGAPLDTVWTNYEQVSAVDPFSGQTVTFWNEIDDSVPNQYLVTNPPGAIRDYNGLEVTLEKRFTNKWSFNTSYTYAKSTGLIPTSTSGSSSLGSYFDNPNAHVNAIGNFGLERRHQFKLNASWMGPLGINLSCYYRYLSGRPYTRRLYSPDLDLDLNQGSVYIFAEAMGSRRRPAISQLDLKLEKSFNFDFGRVAMFVDVFNVFNANTATSVQDISTRTQTVSGTPVAFEGATAILAPRIFRLGLKFEF